MRKRGEIDRLSSKIEKSQQTKVPVPEEELYQVLETVPVLNEQGEVLEVGLM